MFRIQHKILFHGRPEELEEWNNPDPFSESNSSGTLGRWARAVTATGHETSCFKDPFQVPNKRHNKVMTSPIKTVQSDSQSPRDFKEKGNSLFYYVLCAKHCARYFHIVILLYVKFYVFLLKHERGSTGKKKEHWSRSQIPDPATFYLTI